MLIAASLSSISNNACGLKTPVCRDDNLTAVFQSRTEIRRSLVVPASREGGRQAG